MTHYKLCENTDNVSVTLNILFSAWLKFLVCKVILLFGKLTFIGNGYGNRFKQKTCKYYNIYVHACRVDDTNTQKTTKSHQHLVPFAECSMIN